MGDHIIPRFILRGFAINPESKKDNQTINILFNGNVKNEKIAAAFSIDQFYSRELENSLNKDFENKVAIIFQDIKKSINQNEFQISLNDYKLLIRFFVSMWRRNDIHVKDIKLLFEKTINMTRFMLKEEYKNKSIDELYNSKLAREMFYDKIIKETKDDDFIVKRTFENYIPNVFVNNTNIHFPLQNSYGTLIYSKSNDGSNVDYENPEIIIEPISNYIYFILFKNKANKDDMININIESCNDEKTIKQLIKMYINPNTTSFVIDDTNEKFIKELLEERKINL